MNAMFVPPIQVKDGPRGRVATVYGPWTADVEAAVADPAVIRLNVLPGDGQPPMDLNALAGVAIQEIGIGDRRITDLEPLAHVRGPLKRASFILGPDALVEMSWFPDLEEVFVDWSLVEGWPDRSESLTNIYLGGFDGATLEPLGLNPQVERLRLDRSPVETLDGIDRFPQLERLWIGGAARLTSAAALRLVAGTLRELYLDTCTRLGRLDDLSELTGLTRLEFPDCRTIESLAPIAPLVELRDLRGPGSTRIADLDLTPVLGLPRLTEFRMQSRRGYTPSVDDVRAEIARRAGLGDGTS
jgi:hypothetical protein